MTTRREVAVSATPASLTWRVVRVVVRRAVVGAACGAVLALLMAGTPSVLPAQSLPDSSFDARTNAALQRLLEESRAAGLPDAPLINRIRQGAARRVAGERLLALVRTHADSMRAAREALGSRASADELDAGAAALHAGASRATLRRLRVIRPAGTATTAMVVLTDLLWRGVAAADATDAVASLAERSPDRALLQLQGAVARDGAASSPQRLRALVEQFAVPKPRLPPSSPPSRPAPPIPDSSNWASSAATGAVGSRDGWSDPGPALSLISLSAPAKASPQALLAEGRWLIPLGSGWEVTPASALRLDEDGNRYAAALRLSRSVGAAAPLGARLWLTGEVRSPFVTARSELPLDGGLELRSAAPRRTPDVTVLSGADLQRRVGGWTWGGALSLGHSRFSRLETVVEWREIPAAADTLTPRPDTLVPRRVAETRRDWRVLRGTTVRGGISLRRGSTMVEVGAAQRVGILTGSLDSVTARAPTLVTVSAERTVSPWATLVGQWASHDPSRLAGTLSLSDSKWRLGVRLAEGRRRGPAGSGGSRGVATGDERPEGAAGAASEVRPHAGAVTLDVRRESVGIDTTHGTLPRIAVRVRAPGARMVHLEGDLTGWTPVLLLAAGDHIFTGTFSVSGTLLRLRVRLDGGPWVTPAGAPTQRDEFGDDVAVYLVPNQAVDERR